jgi:hypothetical protein
MKDRQITNIRSDSSCHMTTPVDGKSFPNISANSAQFGLKGGYYVVAAIGTITTSVELQMLGPDGSTFVSLPTALKGDGVRRDRWRLCASWPVSFHFDQRDRRHVLRCRCTDLMKQSSFARGCWSHERRISRKLVGLRNCDRRFQPAL